jgi:hypothetical protein
MSIGFIFWLLMLLWIIGWVGGNFGPPPYTAHWQRFNVLFLFILLFLLGWREFGFIIRG